MTTESSQSGSGRIFPLLLIAVGVVLLVFMISVEGEPGALPLLLTLSGIVWLAISLYRNRKVLKREDNRS